MNKIPATSWLKMIAIVSIHLCLVGWIGYIHREPIGNFAATTWGYITDGYGACERFVVGVWSSVPSYDQLRDGFIGILKLEPFK